MKSIRRNYDHQFGQLCVVAVAGIIGTAFALGVIPGLDILAWHLIKPTSQWAKIVLAAIEFATLWPRVVLGFLGLTGSIALAAAITDL